MANEKFKYRVCGIILNGDKILTMKDECSPYYYLPGGKVKMGETAESAIIREISEELGIIPKIVRPLWLNQSFFTEDVEKLKFHELCVYFLLDIKGTGLSERGEKFTVKENKHILEMEWLKFDRLENEYFYPLFLKKAIFNLPKTFTLMSEFE